MPTAKFMTYGELRGLTPTQLWKKALSAQKRGALEEATLAKIRSMPTHRQERAALIKAIRSSQVYCSRRDTPGYESAISRFLSGEPLPKAISGVVEQHLSKRLKTTMATVRTDVKTMKAVQRGTNVSQASFRRHVIQLFLEERHLRETMETRLENRLLSLMRRELERFGRKAGVKNYKPVLPASAPMPKKKLRFRKKEVPYVVVQKK